MEHKNMTYELKIKAIIDEAQRNLGTFEKQLKSTWENGAPPKHMSKGLENIRAHLMSLQEIAKKGVVDSSDLALAENDYKAFAKAIHDLSIEFKLFTADQKKAMLSEEEQRAMSNRTAAIKAYNEELKKNREILAKRDSIKAEKTAVESRQQPARNDAKRILEDYGKRKENLNNIGPVLSPAAKQYSDSLEEQSRLLDQIKIKQSAIEKLRKAGRREDRDNSLTQSLKELEQLEKEYAKFDSMAGKSEYNQAMEKYAESVAEVDAAISKANAEIASMDEELVEFDKKLNKLQVNDTKEAFNELKKELKALGVEGVDEIDTMEGLKKAVEKLNGQALQKVDDNIQKLTSELDSLDKQGREAKKGIDETTNAIKRQEEAVREREAFEGKIKQFLGLAGAVEVMRNAIRNAFSTIQELDKTMTEMAVVTDLEVGDYWNQLGEHAERATELGASINDMYKAETLYYQQGLKTEEVVALSTQTLKMATIAGLDSADATDKMTAALRGFNMELNETSAQRVADVYSELAAITAADVDEIASAMTKTASIASSAGMEFETTAAFLSQIIETTRESAETAGTAMKTVVARFSEVKKLQNEGVMSGEDSEGEIIDVNKIQTALRTVGISMDEFFKGTEGLDSVFLKLAEKWDTLDVKTQRYIATTAAGSRQQSRFIAMMSDYARTQELVVAANTSAGASQRQFEKTVESLDHKLNALKTAWQEFSMSILESDLVKFGVDILTKFLEIINKATSAFDGIGGSLMKIMTVVSLFKLGQKVFEKFKAPLFKFFSDLTKMGYQAGFDSGKAYADGVKAAKDSETNMSNEDISAKTDAIMNPEKKKTVGQKVADKIGLGNIQAGSQMIRGRDDESKELNQSYSTMVYGKETNTRVTADAAQKARQARIDAVKAAQTKANEKQQTLEDYNSGKIKTKKGKTFSSKSNEVKKAKKESNAAQEELKAAKKELIAFDETEKNVQERSLEGWNKVGQGVQQMGGAIAGVGIGVSMLGGIFDSLGLEEFGEGFSVAGNMITMFGGAISLIGTLIPVVAKVAVSAGISVQAAWWWLVAIVAVVALLAVAIVGMIKDMEANKLENRMKAAAEATAEAREQAEQAKQAYDEMLSDQKSYKELQKTLEQLTYGTQEWRQALIEANNQVLSLLQTYPELAKYLTKGAEGQLQISDEGWDALIEQQEQAVANAQNLVMNRQLDENKLKMESVTETYNSGLKTATMVYDSTTDTYVDGTTAVTKEVVDEETGEVKEETSYVKTMDLIDAELQDIYINQNSSLEEQSEKVKELAEAYGVTESEIIEAGRALAASRDEMEAIAEESENIARANLTASASDEVLNSEFSSDVVDAFSTSVNGAVEQAEKQATVAAMQGKNKRDSEEFMSLAEEYGVSSEMTGDALTDTQKLYAAMAGLKSIEDIPDGIAENEQKMLEAIAEMKQGTDRNEKMEEYTNKLEALYNKNSDGELLAQNISGIFSDGGLSMTADFAASLLSDTNGDGQGDSLNEEALKNQAISLGYDSIDAWAEALGKTTDELREEAEKNAKNAVNTNKKNLEKLNAVIGTSDKQIAGFGENVKLSVENTANLSDKMIQTIQTSDAETAAALKTQLDAVLTDAGSNADKVASALNAIDWQSAADWDGLQETFEALGVTWTETMAQFVDQAKFAAQAIDIIDLESLGKEIASMYNTLKSIQSGEQGRAFDQEVYDQIIASNADLAKNFTQIGDKFYYLGGSMDNLTEALEQGTIAKLAQAEKQLQNQKTIADTAVSFTTGGSDGKTLDLSKGYDSWTDEDKKKFLQGFSQEIGKKTFDGAGVKEGQDAQIMSYITDESGKSLGMSLGTNYEVVSGEDLNAYLDGITRLMTESEDYWEQITKIQSDSRITSYTLDSASTNASASAAAMSSGNKQEAVERGRALSIQAVDSGMVSESMLAEYSDLLEQYESGNYKDGNTSADIAERIKELQNNMANNMKQIIYNQEGVSDIIDLQNRVAEALYNARQQEIDKLTQINDSVNSASERMISKVQEQIDDTRQARENEKMEQQMADSQSRLAYLMSDTSGAGALEAQALEEDLTEQQQNYEDDLINQGLQKLSDDNAAAAEQRERQIALMEASLEHDQETGELTREAESIVFESLDQINNGVSPLDTEMGQIISGQEDWENLSEEQRAQNELNFNTQAATAANAQAKIKEATEDVEGAVEDDTAVNEAAKTEIDGKSLNATVRRIQEAFAKEYGGKYYDEQGNEVTVQSSESNVEKRKTAVTKATTALANSKVGLQGFLETKEYKDAFKAYQAANGGSESDFRSLVQTSAGTKTKGRVALKSYTVQAWDDGYIGNYNEGVSVTIGGTTYSDLEFRESDSSLGDSNQEKTAYASSAVAKFLGTGTNGQLAVYDSVPYIWKKNKWRTLFINSSDTPDYNLGAALQQKLNAFETGGLADYTGLAWLDGTKSHPELVLNARDTENFIQLKDILSDILNGTNTVNNVQSQSSGDNYFDIQINVEDISNDYDVEQLANKIRSLLYNDATYRNVNAVNLIR